MTKTMNNTIATANITEMVTVKQLLEICVPSGKSFSFATPGGFVELTNQEAQKVLSGEMNPTGYAGGAGNGIEMESEWLLEMECEPEDIEESETNITADAY